jgi:hypothetical protein
MIKDGPSSGAARNCSASGSAPAGTLARLEKIEDQDAPQVKRAIQDARETIRWIEARERGRREA